MWTLVQTAALQGVPKQRKEESAARRLASALALFLAAADGKGATASLLGLLRGSLRALLILRLAAPGATAAGITLAADQPASSSERYAQPNALWLVHNRFTRRLRLERVLRCHDDLKLALNGTQRRKYEQVARTDAAGHRASVLVLVLGRRAPGLGCCFLL